MVFRTIRAPLPDDSCYLSVAAMHPALGPFFTASFRGQRSRSALHSDEAGLKYLIRRVTDLKVIAAVVAQSALFVDDYSVWQCVDCALH